MTDEDLTAKRKRKGVFLGKGALIQSAAIVIFIPMGLFYEFSWIFAIPIVLFITGSLLSYKYICGHCGNRLSGKEVKICLVCKARII